MRHAAPVNVSEPWSRNIPVSDFGSQSDGFSTKQSAVGGSASNQSVPSSRKPTFSMTAIDVPPQTALLICAGALSVERPREASSMRMDSCSRGTATIATSVKR